MDSQQEEKINAFEMQQPIMRHVYEVGFQKHVEEEVKNLNDAFDLEKHKPSEENHKCLCCMDERTPYGVHSAGSGALLSDEDFDKYFEEIGADSISSHDGCGAAILYAQKMGLNVAEADKIIREWAEKKAKQKGVPHIHLGVEKPFHSARVCYYDATGKFNYDGVEGLPEGFVVARKQGKEPALAEAGVAKDIIFGHHGFGEELLNSENPFVFVAVAETESELSQLKSELSTFAAQYGDKVTVDGFLAPKAE